MTDHQQSPTPPDSPAYGQPPTGGDPVHSPYYETPHHFVDADGTHIGPTPVYQPQRTNGFATASLVLGLVGLWPLWGIGPTLALIFGFKARRQIDASQGAEGGRKMATAGIWLGAVSLAIGALLIGLFVVAAANTDSEDDLGAVPSAEPAEPVPFDTGEGDLVMSLDEVVDIATTSIDMVEFCDGVATVEEFGASEAGFRVFEEGFDNAAADLGYSTREVYDGMVARCP